MSRAYGSSRSFRAIATFWMRRILSSDEIKKVYVFNGHSSGVKNEHGDIDMELTKSEDSFDRPIEIDLKRIR
jgi:hypothetical protein